jgi:hypothetical protein
MRVDGIEVDAHEAGVGRHARDGQDLGCRRRSANPFEPPVEAPDTKRSRSAVGRLLTRSTTKGVNGKLEPRAAWMRRWVPGRRSGSSGSPAVGKGAVPPTATA